jgi:hypothetical protein
MIQVGKKYTDGYSLLVIKAISEGAVKYDEIYPDGEEFARAASLIEWECDCEDGSLTEVQDEIRLA